MHLNSPGGEKKKKKKRRVLAPGKDSSILRLDSHKDSGNVEKCRSYLPGTSPLIKTHHPESTEIRISST